MRTGPRLLRSRSLVLIHRLGELYLCSREVQNILECWRVRNIKGVILFKMYDLILQGIVKDLKKREGKFSRIALYFFSYIEGIFIYHSGTPFSHSLRTNKVTIESNSVITTLSPFNVGLSGFLSTVPSLPIVQMYHFPMKNVHV